MDDTKPKPFVFVLMPFSDDFADAYEVGIKPACTDAGAYCERIDEQIFVESILERVYNQISKADIIVAEMTGRNPNVFYEVGYAHALNKRVILLTQNADDIPFDLKHYPHIVYSGRISTLKSELEARVRWCIENPKESLSAVELNLEFFINTVSLLNNPTVDTYLDERDIEWATDHAFAFHIDVHNATKRVIQPDAFDVAVIMPDSIPIPIYTPGIRSRVRYTERRIIYNLIKIEPLFPDGWGSLPLVLLINRRQRPPRTPVEMNLRLFSQVGPRDYPFKMKFPALTESA